MESVQENLYQLASRWSRIGASLVDGLVLGIFLIPLAYFTGGFDGLYQKPPVQPSLGYQIVMAVLGFGLYCAINWKMLEQSGQTVGKKVLNIKVVNIDGSPSRVQDLVFKRYAFMLFLVYIPFIGGFLNLVNLSMIFGKQRRALHDRVAKTQVISS